MEKSGIRNYSAESNHRHEFRVDIYGSSWGSVGTWHSGCIVGDNVLEEGEVIKVTSKSRTGYFTDCTAHLFNRPSRLLHADWVQLPHDHSGYSECHTQQQHSCNQDRMQSGPFSPAPLIRTKSTFSSSRAQLRNQCWSNRAHIPSGTEFDSIEFAWRCWQARDSFFSKPWTVLGSKSNPSTVFQEEKWNF